MYGWRALFSSYGDEPGLVVMTIEDEEATEIPNHPMPEPESLRP